MWQWMLLSLCVTCVLGSPFYPGKKYGIESKKEQLGELLDKRQWLDLKRRDKVNSEFIEASGWDCLGDAKDDLPVGDYGICKPMCEAEDWCKWFSVGENKPLGSCRLYQACPLAVSADGYTLWSKKGYSPLGLDADTQTTSNPNALEVPGYQRYPGSGCDSPVLSVRAGQSPQDCLKLCQSYPICRHFVLDTFAEYQFACRLYSECKSSSVTWELLTYTGNHPGLKEMNDYSSEKNEICYDGTVGKESPYLDFCYRECGLDSQCRYISVMKIGDRERCKRHSKCPQRVTKAPLTRYSML